MKNKTFYILRHGETDFNKQGRVQGRGVDASLNDTGHQQAQQVYRALGDIPFDVVFTSNLVRTHQTVAPFLEKGLLHKKLAGLDEISWGDQEGLKASPEALNHYADVVNSWRKGDLNLRVGGGETPTEVMERQKEAFEEIGRHKGECILICMHGRAIRILLCWLLNYPLQYMDGFPHQNGAYYKLVKRPKDYFVAQFNETGHLK